MLESNTVKISLASFEFAALLQEATAFDSDDFVEDDIRGTKRSNRCEDGMEEESPATEPPDVETPPSSKSSPLQSQTLHWRRGTGSRESFPSEDRLQPPRPR